MGGAYSTSGTANGQVLDHYLHTQYEVIRLVHDNLAAIQAVASHLTPVEDLVDFREEVGALYAKLGVLTTASELILSATTAGIGLLTAADAAAQRTLLELGSAALKDAEYFATATGLAAAVAAIATLNTQMDGALADLLTKATKLELQVLVDEVALIYPRLDLMDILLAAHGTKLDTIEGDLSGLVAQDVAVDSRLTSLTNQITGTGTAVNLLETRVISNEDGAAITVGRVTMLETNLVDLETGQTANTLAVQDLTSHTSMLDGVTVSQGQLITGLTSRIDGVENGGNATALAVQDLTTTVTEQGALITATSESNTQLASRLTNAETGLASNASGLSSLTTEVTVLGDQLTIASEDITAVKAEISSPGNLAPNAGFEADTFGWSIFNRGAGWASTQLGRNLDAATMLPLATNALSLSVTTQPTGALGIKSDNLPTRGGQRYIMSGWLAALNCTATLEWRLLDQLGQIIQFGSIGDAKLDGGETDINLWPRLWGEIPANADARELQFQIWIQTVTAPGPKLWLLRPMLEEVSGLQIGPSPWVPGMAGFVGHTAEAIDTLTARIDGVGEDLTITASAVTALSGRVDTTEATLGNTATAVDALSLRVTETESYAQDITELAGRVGTTEAALVNEMIITAGNNAAAVSSINALGARVGTTESAVSGHSTAINTLDTRVDANENQINAQAQDIVQLQSGAVVGNKIFIQPTQPSILGRAHGDLWIDTDDGNKPYGFENGAWVLRPLASGIKVFVVPEPPVASTIGDLWFDSNDGNHPYRWTGTVWQDISDNRITLNASALTALTTRVTSAEGTNTSQATQLTALESKVNNPSTGVSATATAVNSLTTRVTETEGDISAQATSLSSLTTQVNGNTASVTTYASSIDGLEAKWNLTLDVNGYISGINSVNNGVKSLVQIVCSKFELREPGQAGKVPFAMIGGDIYINSTLHTGNGLVISKGGGFMKVTGSGFGVGNEFLEWYGPEIAITSCSRSNAIYYFTKTGDAYFGGALSAGVLKNSVTSSAYGNVSVQTGGFGTNGAAKVVTCSMSYGNDGYLPNSIGGNATISCTLSLKRSYNRGAFTQVSSIALTGNRTYLGFDERGYHYRYDISGASTFTDNMGGLLDFNYEGTVSAANGFPISINGDMGNQRLTVISIEE